MRTDNKHMFRYWQESWCLALRSFCLATSNSKNKYDSVYVIELRVRVQPARASKAKRKHKTMKKQQHIKSEIVVCAWAHFCALPFVFFFRMWWIYVHAKYKFLNIKYVAEIIALFCVARTHYYLLRLYNELLSCCFWDPVRVLWWLWICSVSCDKNPVLNSCALKRNIRLFFFLLSRCLVLFKWKLLRYMHSLE